MQSRVWIRAILTLSTVGSAACETSSAPPYAGPNPYVSDESAASDDEPNGGPGAGKPSVSGSSADISLLSDATFDGYLADSDDRALYMFANDVPGSEKSACEGACIEKWPVFDVKDVSVGDGLVGTDFTRFIRGDGSWQTAFKGHPLYYFAMDGDTGEVSGDGVGGRWFVARDYFAFLGAKADLTPEGAAEVAPYLTNRAGRTSYVFMKDTAGGTSAPVSACNDGCLDMWPIWPAPASLDNLILPSDMQSLDFEQFDRVVGGKQVKQLTYRGWPLYYFAADDLPGETAGHLTGAWRAIDPVTFADNGIPPAVPGSGY